MDASKRSVVLRLAPLLCAISAFPQSGAVSVDHANQPGKRRSVWFAKSRFSPCQLLSLSNALPTMLRRQRLGPAGSPPRNACHSQTHPSRSHRQRWGTCLERIQRTQRCLRDYSPPNRLTSTETSITRTSSSLDGGWLPINIPFPLDIFVGDAYNTYPLKYTLVPIFASLRWHMGGPWGPVILRGNFDLTFTGSVTAIPRGPETRYFSYIMGIRRNFVPRNSRIAPYFDVRLGVGNIDAKGPEGVPYAQGQDLTFTVNMGSGVRYNFNPRYAISAGMNFMHISNLDLSESNGKPNWGVRNYGINVYGPMVGIDIQLRRHPRQSE